MDLRSGRGARRLTRSGPSGLAPALASALASAALVTPSTAQTLDDIRDQLRQELDQARYPQFITAMVDFSDETELSSGTFDLDDSVGTRIRTLKLPFQTDFPLADAGPSLYVEGNLGYLRANARFDDLFGGELPGLEAGADSEWSALSGLGGVGVKFPLAEGLHLTPILDLALAYVENDTDYFGPGAPLLAAVSDGILFNWHATTFTYGGALRLDYTRPLGALELATLLRYDLRRTETLDATDEAQDVSVSSQRLTAKVELSGPTGLSVVELPLGWRTDVGYSHLPGGTGDTLGFHDFFELGAGLELDASETSLPLSRFGLSGAVFVGENITGWTVGLGFRF